MTDIKLDSRNYRVHDDRNKNLIKKSLQEYGTGRSIVVDSDGEIIAGNGVYEQAKELGIPVKEIENDGKELIVIKRTDLKRDDEKRKGLAIMDNSASDSSKFDVPLLQEDFDVPTLFVKNKKKKLVDYYVEETNDWVKFPDEPENEVQEHITRIMQYLGEDTSREGLLETPKRVQKAIDEIFAGYKQNPKDLMKTFTQGTCEEMVILKNCEFYSTCEHHMFPFFGHISIGYIPNKKVIGVSKLARLADLFAKRMQIQERMTSQIADTLMKELDAKGVYVVCEGVHFCMRSRGVKKQDASMITSAVRWVFKKDAKARQEFLTLIKN